jgi:hypothetical protein
MAIDELEIRLRADTTEIAKVIEEAKKSWAWASDLCTLLDVIEANAGDEKKVLELTAARFDIARKHGLQVTLVQEAPAATQ